MPPDASGQSVDEYLAVRDDATFEAEVTPEFVSPAHWAARRTGSHCGQTFFAYSTRYLMNVEHAANLDVEATTAIRQPSPGRQVHLERWMDRLGLYPARLMGTAYGWTSVCQGSWPGSRRLRPFAAS